MGPGVHGPRGSGSGDGHDEFAGHVALFAFRLRGRDILQRKSLRDRQPKFSLLEQCCRFGACFRRIARALAAGEPHALFGGPAVGDGDDLPGTARELNKFRQDAGTRRIEGDVDAVRGKLPHTADQTGSVGCRDRTGGRRYSWFPSLAAPITVASPASANWTAASPTPPAAPLTRRV